MPSWIPHPHPIVRLPAGESPLTYSLARTAHAPESARRVTLPLHRLQHPQIQPQLKLPSTSVDRAREPPAGSPSHTTDPYAACRNSSCCHVTIAPQQQHLRPYLARTPNPRHPPPVFLLLASRDRLCIPRPLLQQTWACVKARELGPCVEGGVIPYSSGLLFRLDGWVGYLPLAVSNHVSIP